MDTALIITAAALILGIIALAGMWAYAIRKADRIIDRYSVDPADEVVAREDRAAARGRYIIR